MAWSSTAQRAAHGHQQAALDGSQHHKHFPGLNPSIGWPKPSFLYRLPWMNLHQPNQWTQPPQNGSSSGQAPRPQIELLATHLRRQDWWLQSRVGSLSRLRTDVQPTLLIPPGSSSWTIHSCVQTPTRYLTGDPTMKHSLRGTGIGYRGFYAT
jgi:hypothetical protein